MPPVDHLGHVHLKVTDLDRALEFYGSLLGLDVTERHRNFAFCSLGDHHHDLALQEVPGADESPEPEGPAVGLYHVAWEVDDGADLADLYDRLRERDVSVSPVDHGISKALYFDDPDGNGVEVYLDTRVANDQELWHGQNSRFDPQTLRE